MKTSQLPVLILLALAACGDSTSSGSLTGTILGRTFSIADAASVKVPMSDSPNLGVTGTLGAVVMSSSAGTCSDAEMNIDHPGQQVVEIALGDNDGTTFTAPTAPGVFTVYDGTGAVPPKLAFVVASVLDAICGSDTVKATAATGTVTLSAVNGDTFAGTLDVVLDSGDHVTGRFDPVPCAELAGAFSSTPKAACE